MIIRSIILTWQHSIGQELHSYIIFLLSSWHADDNEHTLSIHGNLRAFASYLVHGSGLTPAATQYMRPKLVTYIGSHHPNVVGCFIRVDKSWAYTGCNPSYEIHDGHYWKKLRPISRIIKSGYWPTSEIIESWCFVIPKYQEKLSFTWGDI